MELVRYLERLLRTHRRNLGTRTNTRSLTCYNQAILILRHFRDRTDPTRLATDHHISRATAYRYIDEGTTMLPGQAPQTHGGNIQGIMSPNGSPLFVCAVTNGLQSRPYRCSGLSGEP
ncbi:hypothetical protein [Nocardiopsis salina]|uniref:hypothetical protein n=1 Tax=Nocardiopsis salina TaxID=245836 RepID=UPI000344CC81|nr:hypothetical protein [Nocardiopsis salina]